MDVEDDAEELTLELEEAWDNYKLKMRGGRLEEIIGPD